ncbi:SURF4-domain-containing protein [Flagelloscypha sp. PMI_526]|nr:SURF4-domain-containing protein [Flagelloscypha sp. PMI_526]
MTSRISIARPASQQSYTPDPYGLSNSGRSAGYRSANPDDPLEKLRAYSKQVEDYVEIYSQPLKPHLPAIGRFLIVWGDQIWKFPWGLSHIFLLINIVVMLGGSGGVIFKRYTEYSVAGLLGVVVIQGFGYGLIFDLNFFLRNLSVVGGLFMVFSDSMINKNRNFAGLPTLSDTDRRKYFLLTGRVLLIFLFLGFILQGEWSFARLLMSVVGLGLCVMVAVGFKAKWSASFLVIVLSIFNVFANNWWAVHSNHPQKDFLKYDFFQTLSIVGGLILLVNMGPGGLSVDEKKKAY